MWIGLLWTFTLSLPTVKFKDYSVSILNESYNCRCSGLTFDDPFLQCDSRRFIADQISVSSINSMCMQALLNCYCSKMVNVVKRCEIQISRDILLHTDLEIDWDGALKTVNSKYMNNYDSFEFFQLSDFASISDEAARKTFTADVNSLLFGHWFKVARQTNGEQMVEAMKTLQDVFTQRVSDKKIFQSNEFPMIRDVNGRETFSALSNSLVLKKQEFFQSMMGELSSTSPSWSNCLDTPYLSDVMYWSKQFDDLHQPFPFNSVLMPVEKPQFLERMNMIHMLRDQIPDVQLQNLKLKSHSVDFSTSATDLKLKNIHLVGLEETKYQETLLPALKKSIVQIEKSIRLLENQQIRADSKFKNLFSKFFGFDDGMTMDYVAHKLRSLKNVQEITFVQETSELVSDASTLHLGIIKGNFPSQLEKPLIFINKESDFWLPKYSEKQASTINHELTHYMFGTEDINGGYAEPFVYQGEKFPELKGKQIPILENLFKLNNIDRTNNADTFGLFMYVINGGPYRLTKPSPGDLEVMMDTFSNANQAKKPRM